MLNNDPGIGNIQLKWKRKIYDDIFLHHIMSYNKNKEQNTYYIEFNPKKTNLIPIVTTGPKVVGRNTMSSLVKDYENKGYSVVFGVNGDAYNMNNGIPSGISINNGVLLVTSLSKYAFGITEKGDIKYGNAKLLIDYETSNMQKHKINHVNRNREKNKDHLYLYTNDYDQSTNSLYEGLEVVLKVINKDKLKIGKPYELKVEKIIEVTDNIKGNKTPINLNKAVLAANKDTISYKKLKELKIGDKLTVNIKGLDNNINWNEITTAMGIFHLLLDDGVETENLKNLDIHPRTSMGLKKDGSVILMQNDGRQVGWAKGLSFKEMVQFMKEELDVVTIFNFDGGGSSTIMATLPGNEHASILNSPSDGIERDNANALLFVRKNNKTSELADKIHLYPNLKNNYSTKAIILENSELSFNVKATNNYYKTKVPENIRYEVLGNIGTITKDGLFKASKGSSKGKILVKYNNLESNFNIEVVDEISKIETLQTIISIGLNKTQKINFKAYKNGVPVILNNKSLNFNVEPKDLIVINSNGIIKSTNKKGTGKLKASYNNYEITIPVEVGKKPKMLLDFEEDVFNNNWKINLANIPSNGGYGNISMNYNERFVKHGEGSLRIDYDFATKPLTGTVAIELMHQQEGLILSGQPKAIGFWVYGDNNGGWLKVLLGEGKLLGNTKINFTGWKYIEIDIPLDTDYPYILKKAIRLIGTPNIANNKKGTIYIDSIRAIYDFKNDDINEPVLIEDSLYPKENSTIKERQPLISLKVKDDDTNNNISTGINIKRTKMFINDILAKNIQQVINNDASVDIYYNPSAIDKLRVGKQNIKVRVEDNFGNKKFINWSFYVK